MDLQELVALLRRHWLSIVALTLLGGLVALGLSLLQERLYTAQATVLVQPAAGETPNDLNSGANLVERVVLTYAELARTPVVLEPVAQALQLGSAKDLQPAVTTAIASGTTFITIAVELDSPQTAADAANLIGEELASAVEDLAPRQSGTPSIVVSTITPAVAPATPSSPDLPLNVVAGVLVGLLLGLGSVVLRGALDSRVRGRADVRRVTTAPVLGSISRGPSRRAARAGADSARAEDFRRVRTNLRLLDGIHRPRALVVTSCTPDEGQAQFAVNLARTAVEGGLRVCLVEADLRVPVLRTLLRLPQGAGLAELLLGQVDQRSVTHRVEGIDVIPAGGPVANPGDLVTSPGMAAVLESLSASYDLVICAAAPLLAATDGAALGASTDGVVLVAATQRVSRAQLTEATSALEMAGAHLHGVVLNESVGSHAPMTAPGNDVRQGPRNDGDRAGVPQRS